VASTDQVEMVQRKIVDLLKHLRTARGTDGETMFMIGLLAGRILMDAKQPRWAQMKRRLNAAEYDQLAPDTRHCESVGTMLARMHVAGRDYPRHQPNLRGLEWWSETVPVVAPHLTPDQRTLIESELAFQQQLGASAAYAALPRGPIHADLFRDNVMFEGHKLTGFFDFYFAGVDTFLFDIAVCLNDWCIDLESGRLVEERAVAFVAAYDAVRPLGSSERRLMPALMRAAALRFWISRLWDFHLPRDAAVLKAHDPTHFERVLTHRVNEPWHPAFI
jgi:homoserine kinase type II